MSVAELRSRNRKKLVQIGLPLLFIFILSSIVPGGGGRSNSPVLERVQEMDADVDQYLLWLKTHGTQSEVTLFHFISDRLISHAAESSLGHEQSKIMVYYAGFLSGILRLVFLFLASLRLWILLFAGVVFTSFQNWKPYEGADLLGATGNGKLFFSGILTRLSDKREKGIPDVLIPGLACPKMRPISEVMNSNLGKVLKNYKALNQTTGALAGILLAYPEVPFFAAMGDSHDKLSSFSDPTLIHGATAALEAALSVHQAIQNQVAEDKKLVSAESASITNLEDYSSFMKRAFNRTLIPPMKSAIARLHQIDIAAMVLAYEAGKVLSYLREGNRWARRTVYTHLSARAVLHSIPAFAKEYPYEAREIIRNALVYAMRFSVFGPIRLPIAISPEARALRQWSELLMAYPYELRTSTDELELFAHAHDIWHRWETIFFNGITQHSRELSNGSRVTDAGVLFVPVTTLVSMFRSVLENNELARLEALVLSVSQVQRVVELSKDLVSDAVSQEGSRGPLPQYQKVFQPVAFPDAKSLSHLTGVPADILKDWFIIRNIFNIYGWLARQVGSSSVPDHSTVLAVFKGCNDSHDRFVGAKGLVPLRGSYIEDKVGRLWRTRFAAAQTAILADTEEAYQKLMQGIDVYTHELEVGL